MVKQYLLASLLGFLILVPTTTLAHCDCPGLREVIGEYTTVEVTRYRGGLTSVEEAEQHVGESAKVFESEFSLWEEVRYEAPSYEVVCHSVPQEEGDVPRPSERWGNFYGFGVDREVIEVLHVIPSKDEGPRYVFEIVGDELWAFLDGWFYRMKREPKIDGGAS
ncbi:hypothetical protein [Halomonas kalidii]|uniref:Lipoprotein n=1 Tax=Halomonas kalidii TaxID=3043293 RepID=A0ABT6VLS7_9GAMM|nr:hypothetical protein [Halomonas kalidii]MDI5934904.1 hypothetical protein [Halomonas kalidii]